MKVPGTELEIKLKESITCVEVTVEDPDGGKPRKEKQIRVKLTACNPNPGPVSFIICSMINVAGKPNVEHKKYKISKKTVGGVEKWACEADGTTQNPPSYHLGCRQVTLRGKGKQGDTACVFDTDADFELADGDEIGAGDKFTIYTDILQDCPLDNWEPAGGGANDFLVPAGSTSPNDAYNVWVGAKTSVATAPSDAGGRNPHLITWPPGNWFTMAQPDLTWPARYVGTFEGLPAGTHVQFRIPGSPTHDYQVPEDGVLHIDEPYEILAMDPDEEIHPWPEVEWFPTTSVPDGTKARLHIEVFSGPGAPAPYLEEGLFMHSIDTPLIQDTTPPVVRCATARVMGNEVFVQVEATDETTYATDALLVFDPPNDIDVEVEPVCLEVKSSDHTKPECADARFFGTSFQVPDPSVLQVAVFDELGNKALAPVEFHSVLGPAQHPTNAVAVLDVNCSRELSGASTFSQLPGPYIARADAGEEVRFQLQGEPYSTGIVLAGLPMLAPKPLALGTIDILPTSVPFVLSVPRGGLGVWTVPTGAAQQGLSMSLQALMLPGSSATATLTNSVNVSVE